MTALTAAAEPETLVDTVDDEREYYRQEVGEEPDEGTALDLCILREWVLWPSCRQDSTHVAS